MMDTPIPEGPPLGSAELADLRATPIGEVIVNPLYMRRLRMDLIVTAQANQMPRESCTYTVSMSPGILRVPRQVTVPILLIDNHGNLAQGQPVTFGPEGGSTKQTSEVPIADLSVLGGGSDKGRWIYVIADPGFAIAERNEGNNMAKAWCYTLG